jgi:hypothetical protein
MGNLEFVVGQKFSSIQVFREAVRECNVKWGRMLSSRGISLPSV